MSEEHEEISVDELAAMVGASSEHPVTLGGGIPRSKRLDALRILRRNPEEYEVAVPCEISGSGIKWAWKTPGTLLQNVGIEFHRDKDRMRARLNPRFRCEHCDEVKSLGAQRELIAAEAHDVNREDSTDEPVAEIPAPPADSDAGDDTNGGT